MRVTKSMRITLTAMFGINLLLSLDALATDVIYVSNSGNNTIEKFDASGNGTVFASSGLNYPAGLAFDTAGNLYVANSHSATIQKFDSKGQGSLFATWGLVSPSGLAFNNGYLYVANDGANNIIKYDSSGNGTVFTSSGINNPTGLAFDGSGNLYVGNLLSGTIMKYDSNGQGSVFATFFHPYGLAFDSGGNLYVSSDSGNAIEKFDASGNGTVFASSGINNPVGLAFDSAGNLYAVNWANSITKFDQTGQGSIFANAGLYNPLYIAIQSTAQATNNPPSITGQPQSVTANAGANASFIVTATGAMPLNYQWSLNGTNILGATSSTLTVSNIVQTDLGAYAVVVANASGSVISSNAMLSMYPFIETAFAGVVGYWGKDTTLSVEAWGTGPLSYQWFLNGVAILNATNQTLDFPSLQFTNAGLYSVVISSPLGSVTNAPAQVVVNPAGVSIGMYPGVTVSGVVGYTYLIQATSDLTSTNSWTTVAELTLMQPVQLWVDVNVNALSPTNPHRFYRILPGP